MNGVYNQPKSVYYRGFDITLSWGEYDVTRAVSTEVRRAGIKQKLLARAPMVEDAKDYVDYLVQKEAEKAALTGEKAEQ